MVSRKLLALKKCEFKIMRKIIKTWSVKILICFFNFGTYRHLLIIFFSRCLENRYLQYCSVLAERDGVVAPSPLLDFAATHTWYNELGYRLSKVYWVIGGSNVRWFVNWKIIKACTMHISRYLATIIFWPKSTHSKIVFCQKHWGILLK